MDERVRGAILAREGHDVVLNAVGSSMLAGPGGAAGRVPGRVPEIRLPPRAARLTLKDIHARVALLIQKRQDAREESRRVRGDVVSRTSTSRNFTQLMETPLKRPRAAAASATEDPQQRPQL
eukprot:2469158-Pyramimonas_sp.AAC.1